ncbi:MAG: hypothetical protein JWN70_4826 [Planctomycetaceae bacterium]|nr:hypothetical protein [Planctomycetaceae bacterium]
MTEALAKGTWEEFLKIHPDTLWQCDFATKRMWTLRGFVDLHFFVFVFFVFVYSETRRSWISPCTPHPDSAWSCQQARNFIMHTEDVELTPAYVMRDNDTKYADRFDAVFGAV